MFTGSKHNYPPQNTVGRERENCGTQLNSNRHWRDALSSVQLVQFASISPRLRPGDTKHSWKHSSRNTVNPQCLPAQNTVRPSKTQLKPSHKYERSEF